MSTPKANDQNDLAPQGGAGLRFRLRQDTPIPMDVDLSCRAGEILALIGPSGGGKTTVLRALAGLYQPHHGTISMDGHVWLDTVDGLNVSPQSRRVGLVFQDYALFPHMTVAGNVVSSLGHLAKPQRAARVQEMLTLVNLPGFDDRLPDTLSGGQRQRVAVARALARDPQLLLLDEPFSAVDHQTRRRLQRELLLLRRHLNIPIVLVTHDLREAVSLADRVALLHRGRILQVGAASHVASRPVSPEAARLMGESNIFKGRLIKGGSTQTTQLDWNGVLLEISGRDLDEFTDHENVDWMVPSSSVVLHRRERPSRGERENPISGQIEELITFGDQTQVRLRPDHAPHFPLIFSIPTHAAQRNGLVEGVDARVSLLSADIHLMKGDPSQAPEGAQSFGTSADGA